MDAPSLPPDLAARIQRKVDAKLYDSVEQVLLHALEALDGVDAMAEDAAWRDYERREVLKGLEEADRGELVDSETVFAELRRKLEVFRRNP